MRLHNELPKFPLPTPTMRDPDGTMIRFDDARAITFEEAENAFGLQRQRRSWAVRLWWSMVVTVIVGWLLGGIASAQRFETVELPEQFAKYKDEKNAKDLERAVSQLKTTKDLAKLNPSVVREAQFYLRLYIPWKITQKENLPKISETIEDVIGDLDGAQRSSSAGAIELLRSTYSGMKMVAEGNYLPAARINAINALSRLNMRPQDFSGGRPPLPLSYSYTVMFQLYANEKENDGVRAAALHGIHHYVQLAFPAIKGEDRTALINEMNKLLTGEAPSGRDPQAHAYLQRFAVDILNYMRSPDDGALGAQLISISTSETQPDLIAIYSASKLGGFVKELQGKVEKPDEVTKQWAVRAFKAFDSEIERFDSRQRPTPALQQPPQPIEFLEKSANAKKKNTAANQRSMRGGMGMGMGMDMEMGGGGRGTGMDMDGMGMDGMGMGMGMGMGGMGMGGMGMNGPLQAEAPPQPPEVDLSRRKLSFMLQQLLRGATGSPRGEMLEPPAGLMAAVPAAEQEGIKKWVAEILEINEVISDEYLSSLEMWTDALNSQRPALGALAGIEVQQEQDLDGIDIAPRLRGMPGIGMGMLGMPAPLAPPAAGAAAENPAANPAVVPAAPGGLPPGGLPPGGLPPGGLPPGGLPAGGLPAGPGGGIPMAPGALPAGQ